MTTTNIGPRPSNPADISFDARCFEQVGTRTEYVVVLSAPNYPKVFSDRETAAAYARKTGRAVTIRNAAIVRRISWR